MPTLKYKDPVSGTWKPLAFGVPSPATGLPLVTASYLRNGALASTGGSGVTIVWDTAVEPATGIAYASSTGVFTVQSTGWYLITSGIRVTPVTASAGAGAQLRLYRNAELVDLAQTQLDTASAGQHIQLAQQVKLNKGDTFYFTFYANTATNLYISTADMNDVQIVRIDSEDTAGDLAGGQYSQTLGAAAAGAIITITHGLGTKDLVWQMIEVATGLVVDTNFHVGTVDTVLGSFPNAITAGQFRIVILAQAADAPPNYLAPGDLESQLALKADANDVKLIINVKDYGAVGDGVANDAAAINAAATAAATAGVPLYASGTFRINSTVTLLCDADLSGATFRYYGTGIAIQVGATTPLFRKIVNLPKMVAANKTNLGWAQVVGTVGVKVVNCDSCQISTPLISNFETGLLVRGEGQGCAYNPITVLHIDNCKIGHDISADATGWSNENQYWISRISYNSGEGASVAGTRMIRVQTAANLPNDNIWWGGAIEADTPEYHLECAGAENRFLHMRWENPGGCRVLWRTGAFRNVIDHGYGSHQIIQTYDAGVVGQTVLSGQGWKIRHQPGTTGVLQLENGSSSANPAITIMPAQVGPPTASPTTGYSGLIGADRWVLKRSAESFDRIQIDGLNSRIYLCNGATAPTAYFSNSGATAIGLAGLGLFPNVDNASDLGLTSLKWKYIRAATALQTGAFATGSRPTAATAGAGAMVFDTTLGKPIWSDGTNWVEAGAGVQLPSTAERILYVTPRGSDSNDGLSLQSAKLTLAAALTALGATAGIVQLGVGSFSTSASHALRTGQSVWGCGPGLTTITYTGTGALFTTATPGVRSYNQQIKDVALVGPGKVGTSIAIDLSDMSNVIIDSINIATFGTGIKNSSAVLGGAVYNDVSRSVINSCTTGADITPDGSNSLRWRGDKFGACTTAVNIVDSNQNNFHDCQFEANTTAIKIDASLAGLSDHNSVTFCRFESNTLPWNIVGPNVRNTEIVYPGILGTWNTPTDAGTRTTVLSTYPLMAPLGTVRRTMTRTGSYTITDGEDVVIMNAASGTVTLPSAVTATTGRQYDIKNIHSTALTLATTSSQTIDGAAPGTLAQWAKVRVISNGTNWLTL